MTPKIGMPYRCEKTFGSERFKTWLIVIPSAKQETTLCATMKLADDLEAKGF